MASMLALNAILIKVSKPYHTSVISLQECSGQRYVKLFKMRFDGNMVEISWVMFDLGTVDIMHLFC